MKLAIMYSEDLFSKSLLSRFKKTMGQYGIEQVNSLDEADQVLYITWGITSDYFYQAYDELDRLQKLGIKVIIVGDLAVCQSHLFNKYEGNPNFTIIYEPSWVYPVINNIAQVNLKDTTQDLFLHNNTLPFYGNTTSLAFLLQKGCKNRCSFCQVHYMDSKLQDVPFEEGIIYLTNMINNGTKYITLSGENTALYGLKRYGRKRLHEFVRELSKVEGLEMIAVNELVAGDMYPELLMEIISNPKVVNVSMQLETASNRLLKKMNRNYQMRLFDYYTQQIRRAGVYVSTILMGGFPTENKVDMWLTTNYLRKREIITTGVCPYRDFEGYIPSSQLKQLTRAQVEQHANHLVNQAQLINMGIYAKQFGKPRPFICLGSIRNTSIFESAIPNTYAIVDDCPTGFDAGTIITGIPIDIIEGPIEKQTAFAIRMH